MEGALGRTYAGWIGTESLQSLEKDKLYHIVAYNQDHKEIQQKLKKRMDMKIAYGKESKSQTKDSGKVEFKTPIL